MTIARLKVIFILPPSFSFFPVRFGIECSQFACVGPRISTMSPPANGSFSGDFEDADAASSVPGGAGLCLSIKSLLAPSEKEAMAGSRPRNRSSSLWYEMLSAPEA